jgi:hypothetical protein
MTKKKLITPGRPCSARVEFYACREDVETMLAQGYSARMIHEHLAEQGRMTCSYSAFCDYLRGGGKRLHSKKKNPPQEVVQQQKTAPRIISAPSDRLMDPRHVDLSKLI